MFSNSPMCTHNVSYLRAVGATTRGFFISFRLHNSEVVLRASRHYGKNKTPTLCGGIENCFSAVLSATRRQRLRPPATVYPQASLLEDREVVLAAVGNYGRALQWASARLRGDAEVVAVALEACPRALQFAMTSLRADRNLVRVAVAADGRVLRFCPDLQEDPEICLLACGQHWRALQWTQLPGVSQVFRECVLAAVSQSGDALEWAGDLADDDEVVRVAVGRTGTALALACPRLRGELWCVEAAIASDGWALAYCPPNLATQRPLALSAVRENWRALALLEEDFRLDPEFRAAVLAQWPPYAAAGVSAVVAGGRWRQPVGAGVPAVGWTVAAAARCILVKPSGESLEVVPLRAKECNLRFALALSCPVLFRFCTLNSASRCSALPSNPVGFSLCDAPAVSAWERAGEIFLR